MNFFLISVLPVLFLGLFASVVFSLVIPPAAAVFLSVPNGMLALFLWVFSFDFSLVLSGFSLGAGGAVWTIGTVVLSERVRFRVKTKAVLFIAFSALFSFAVVLNNVVFTGCKLIAERSAVLVQTRAECVFVIDGTSGAATYENFLMRHYGGKLGAVVVLGTNAGAGLSVALRLPSEEVRAASKTATGFYETVVLYDKEFSYGDLQFRFESENKLTLLAEECAVEIDFTGEQSLGADLFLRKGNAGVYYLNRGAVYRSLR